MSTTNDLRSKLAEDDGSLPERWNPDDEAGTTLVGTLLRFETIVTEFGESQIAVIEDADDDHVWGVALFRSVLKKRFEMLAPKPGDTVGIKYVGYVDPRNKDARGYHNYVVRVERSAVVPAAVTTAADAPSADDDDELPF
jgi:hypothetical protein